nr:efflux RND transporter permease subunit [Paenibacillus turpanensis]
MIQRPIAVFLLTAMVLVSGGIAGKLLPIKLQPSVDGPFLAVVAHSSKDIDLDQMEKEVTFPLETIVNSRDIVKDANATTTTKSVQMQVLLKDSAKPEEINKLKEEISQKLNSFSIEMDRTDVRQYTASDEVIMMIALTSNDPDQERVRKELKDAVIPALREIQGISKVEHTLDQYQENYEFELKADRIQSLQQANTIIDELRDGFASPLLGTLDYGKEPYRVRSEAAVTTAEELEQFRLSTGERLMDMVNVRVDKPADHRYLMMSGEPFYEINIFASAHASEVKISEQVQAVLAKHHSEQSTEWQYLFAWDASAFIGLAVSELVVNILFGAGIAAVILLLVFRSFRTTLIVAISMPVCICTTLLSMAMFNYSLNIITLLGIGLGTGMIVDACIVVIENIFRKMQETEDRMDAVISGTKEVFAPVMSSILTTVAVFLPISFMDGILGVFMKQLALTVTVSLLSSLVVALTLIPILSDKLIRTPKADEVKASRVMMMYEKLLVQAVKRRRITLLSFILVLCLSIYALVAFVPTNFLPNISDRSLFINVEVDEKLDYETNLSLMDHAAKQMLPIDGVKEVLYWGNDQSTSRGTFIVLFEDRKDMQQTDEQMKEQIKETIDRTIPYSFLSMGEGQGDKSGQMSISLSGSSMGELVRAVPAIKEELMLIPGVTGTEAALLENSKEWVIEFSKEQLAYHSISRDEVERYVSLVLSGIQDVDIKVDGERTAASIQFPAVYRQSSDALYRLPIRSDVNLTLQDVSTIKQLDSESKRIRKNGSYDMGLTIYFDAASKERVVRDVTQFVDRYQSEIQLSIGGAQQQEAEAFQKLFIAVGVSFAAVFMILTIQFNRFRLPFLIMLSLPFAMIGVSLGFLLTGRDFDMMAMIGIVMLVGIIVNNAIVLIDFIHNHRKDYPDVFTAVIEGSKLRVRPILTTTLTTVGGLIPMFIGGSEASSFQTPIATAVMFGLTFSTFVSLVLVPVLYYFFEGGADRKPTQKQRKGFFKRFSRKAADADVTGAVT